jgi:hypothetical protein
MTMGAKRFGVGILVGLVLALAVVASSGFTYGTFGSFSADQVVYTVKSTETTAVTTEVTTAFTMSSTTGASNGSSSPTVSTVTSSATTSAEFGPATNVQNQAPLDALYSSLANRSVAGVQAAPADTLASEPASVAWLVFIPVAVALVLGLVLYRSSTGRLAKD